MTPDRDRFRALDDAALIDAMARAWRTTDPHGDEYTDAAIRVQVVNLWRGRTPAVSAADHAALALLQPPADGSGDDSDPVSPADLDAMRACVTCGGTGKVRDTHDRRQKFRCPDCNGSGRGGGR